MPNVQVASVLWGSGTYLGQVDGTASPTMDSFFTHVTDSSYLAWLNEYKTPSQTIDYGSFLGRTQITPTSSTSSPIDDSTIQSELIAQINAGHLPAPTNDGAGDSETVYALYFPSGKQICIQGQCSGVVLCAYHGTTSATVDGMHVPYMVLPDAGTMGPGCGAGTNAQNTEDYTSHELIETVTDPLVGIGTLSWYNDSQGEIGDICNAQETAFDTDYVVQKEWSNSAAACIVNKPTSTPGSPTGVTATPKPGGVVELSWTAPSSNGGSALSEYDVYQSTVSGRQGLTVAHVPAGTTTWTSGALHNGTTYRFEIAARNASQVSSPDTTQLAIVADGTAPQVKISSPGPLFQLSKTIHVSYSATDSGSGVGSYDVQQRSTAWNGDFGGWSAVATGTTATSQSVSGAPGHEYCFRVRARDGAGNESGWTSAHCTALPLDDRALSGSGWSHPKDSGAYKGTLTRTTTKGSKLRLAGAKVARIALVVQTCSTCGKVGIYLGSSLWQTVDTHASTTHERVVLLPGTFSLRTTTIGLKALSSGKKVSIDGLGIAQD